MSKEEYGISVIKIGMAPYRPAPWCSHKDTTTLSNHEVFT